MFVPVRGSIIHIGQCKDTRMGINEGDSGTIFRDRIGLANRVFGITITLRRFGRFDQPTQTYDSTRLFSIPALFLFSILRGWIYVRDGLHKSRPYIPGDIFCLVSTLALISFFP